MSAAKLILIENCLAAGEALPPDLTEFLVAALCRWRAGEDLTDALIGNGRIEQRDQWLRVAANCLDLPAGCSDWQRAQALARAISQYRNVPNAKTEVGRALKIAGRLGRLPESPRHLFLILTR